MIVEVNIVVTSKTCFYLTTTIAEPVLSLPPLIYTDHWTYWTRTWVQNPTPLEAPSRHYQSIQVAMWAILFVTITDWALNSGRVLRCAVWCSKIMCLKCWNFKILQEKNRRERVAGGEWSPLWYLLNDVTPSHRTDPSYKTNTITIVKLDHRDFPLNELNNYKCYHFIC